MVMEEALKKCCSSKSVKPSGEELLQVLTPQHDTFVTILAEITGKCSLLWICLLYLSECRVEVLGWPLLSILYTPPFLSGVFLFLPLLVTFYLFIFLHRGVTAAAGFLPEQFFKLFTRRLAALTLCFGSISRGHFSVFGCICPSPKPSNNLSWNRLHAISP